MENHEKEAAKFCAAIKKLAENENNLQNLETYLTYHFAEWLKVFADNPEKLTWEIEQFANIY